MEKQMSTGLRTTFLIHVIVAGIFGLALLFVPEWWLSLQGVSVPVVEPYRLIGAAALAFATSSWLAYRAGVVEKVKIIVQMEIVWTILATIVFLWGLLSGVLPMSGVVNSIIMAAFSVAFIVFYPRD
jgi:hypothetical protein